MKLLCLVLLLIAFLVFSASVLRAGVIVVASNGTGQVSTIQAGINLAAAGDTVLISPGVWTGAVVIDNKPITIGSYYIIDGDTTHISQTIIDGEDIRTGIIIQNCSGAVDTVQVIGLTIRNGRSSHFPLTDVYSNGGGISVMQSVAEISRCVIHHCRAHYGGGVGVIYSKVFMKSNEIYQNVALSAGGGVNAMQVGTSVVFDQIELNSIYLNSAARGNDITYAVTCDPTNIYLDKGSVATNDPYFYYCPAQPQLLINQAIIQQVNSDLWVSPSGDNHNDGLNLQTPLKSISYALSKILPQANSTLTVHVMPGTYSWSQTRESLPLQLKSYVNLIGSEMGSVILNAEQYGAFIIGNRGQDYLAIKNLTLINGHEIKSNLFDLIHNGETNLITVENIHIKDSWAKFNAFRIMSCHNLTVNNLIIEDSQVGNGFNIYVYEVGNFSNFRVQRLSSTNENMYNSSCTGGGIAKPLSAAALQTTVNISNFLITDIVDTSQFWQNMPSGLSIGVEGGNCDLMISNCTIANNSSVTQSGGLNLSLENCNVQVFNTIVSGNTPYEVAMAAYNESAFADVSFSNCLVTGGSDSFFLLSGDISHTWVEGNQFGVPMFAGGDVNDPLFYSLADASPCIDAGTPDISSLSLLPYDLAGNMRVWNNVIDMGCYEFGAPPVANDDPVAPQLSGGISATNYPNPFNPETSIRFHLPVSGLTELGVYNLKGQLVRKLLYSDMAAGTHTVQWDGRDGQNQPVSSGVYLYRIESSKQQCLGKMVLMK